MKKFLFTTFAFFLVLTISGCAAGDVIEDSTEKNEPIVVGAILPLSGPAAVWGDSAKNGILIAQEELKEQGVNVDFIFEDSQADPKEGLKAFNKLTAEDNVDVLFSMFSRVSVPLVELLDETKKPLLMTLVAANGIADKSDYAFRFYSPPLDYPKPLFEKVLTSDKYKTVALLNVNDEYGTSIADGIKEMAEKNGIEIILHETFDPRTTDFRTALTKVKAANPDAFSFVGAVPPEVVNAVKQYKELGLEMDFFETSVTLAPKQSREAVKDIVDGIYAVAYPFTLEKTGLDFRAKYVEKYNEDPLYSSALGYDMVMALAKATDEKHLGADEIAENLRRLGEFNSLNGLITMQENGEFNPPTVAARFEVNELVEIE